MPSLICPPGMVLVRSENGQLLMIPQQALAQMQAHAQAQPQSTMAPRPATPTGAPPVQISTVQVSACMVNRLVLGGPSSAWLTHTGDVARVKVCPG